MPQGVLPFQYQAEPTGKGLTALAGIGVYLDFLYGIGLPQVADDAIGLRKHQGYRDGQMVVALLLLNLAGGEAVQSLETLEADEGLMALVRHAERRWAAPGTVATDRGRFRRGRQRTLPSASAVFRYLEHLAGVESTPRVAGQAVIPPPSPGLLGLRAVNTHLVGEVQRLRPCRTATLDMDAKLVETGKAEALYSYKGTRAYQPLQTYWSEQD
ncbi:MAG: transposase, partial [Chloroflexi bacterium]|nr:transposase [Chloroflexota bacterium]